jgi:uncharacterized repeat protein (TIGR02543 family)
MKSTLGAALVLSLALIGACWPAVPRSALAQEPVAVEQPSSAAAHHDRHPHPRVRNYNGTSTNWSGYAVETNLSSPKSNVVTDVKGTWVVPTVSGTGTSYCAIWVGIDGYSDSTVEQLGTDSDLSSGTPVYYAWYEMYPKSSYEIVGFPVKPGDQITAEVHYNGSAFVLSINNLTESASFSITKTASTAKRSSAEWIVEAPSSGTGTQLALAYFGLVNFSACSATISGVTGAISNSSWQKDAITMQSSGGANEAVPSALSPDGTSFSVTDVMISYTLSAAASPAAGGAVAVSPSRASYYYGAVLSSSATASPGYAFVNWKAAGGTLSNSTSPVTSLTITSNCTLTASFTPLHYTLSATASPSSGGTVAVSPSQATYAYGNVVTISETTNPGYTFAGWTTPSGGTIFSSAAATSSLTITGNCTLTANYTQNSYTVSETDVGGSIALSSTGPYYYGTQLTATAAANPGFMFTGWTCSGCSLSSSTALSTTLTVLANFTLTANFIAATLTVSAALDNSWVYQNTAVTTSYRQCRTMTITIPQDTWPDQSFTVAISQSGLGVVIPSLTFVNSGGNGAVTPTSSFVFTGSSAVLYLVGGPRQADGVTGAGPCTVTLQVTGNISAGPNATTAAVLLTVRPLGDITGDGAVTTADRVQLRKWFNLLPTPNQMAADFDLDGDGAVTANDLAILNSLLNSLPVP